MTDKLLIDRTLLEQALDALLHRTGGSDQVQRIDAAITALCAALAEPVQEPVAWMVYTEGGTSAYVTDNPNDLVGAYRALALYTSPPQRPRLTDEEIDAAAKSVPAAVYELMYGNEITVEKFRAALAEFARAIERKVRGE